LPPVPRQQAGQQQNFRLPDSIQGREAARVVTTAATIGAAKAMAPATPGPVSHLLSGCYQISGPVAAPAPVPARWQLDTTRALVRGDTVWHRATAIGPARERDDSSELRWRPIDRTSIDLMARRGSESVTLRIVVADAAQSADRARQEVAAPPTALRAVRTGCP
jgi:hypothetical protein